MQTKPIWQSKTFWFNVLVVVIGVAAVMADPAQYGDEVAKWAALILAVGNVVLRTISSGAVTMMPQGKKDEQA